MNIMFTGGGTGGHLSIARNVAEEIASYKQHNIYYMGSTRGQDKLWFEGGSLFEKTFFLHTEGVVNKNIFTLPKSLMKQVIALKEAMSILKSLQIKRVFSVGGYSAAPASMAAILLRIPLFIHEQNACMGSLNRLLKPFCTALYSSYLPDSMLKNYPIQEDFFKTQRIRNEVKTILFLGGSQGALAINDLALMLAEPLKQRGIHIIHQSGDKDYDRVNIEYQKKGIQVELFAFSKDMPSLMQRSDFAVSRAGASSLWELSANALPTLFVPYPYAAKDHQYYNAKFLLDQQLAYMMRETELDIQKVLAILDDVDMLKRISSSLSHIIKQGGTKEIAQALLQDINH